MSENNQDKVWIVQRCIDAWTNHYENWPDYCEEPMTCDAIMNALIECEKKWPDLSFRGHNINHPVIRNIKGAFPLVNRGKTT